MTSFAIIDAGSSAIRLQIAEVNELGSYRVCAQDRQPVRLGHGVFETGVLDSVIRRRALAVLKRFKRQAESHAVTALRAVATSAMREAGDADTFVRDAATMGLRLEVLSEQDEANLTTLGVLSSLSAPPPVALFVDIGGGSTEIAVSEGATTRAAMSLPLGIVRLTERYLKSDPPSEEECKAMTLCLRRQLEVASSLKHDFADAAFGSGGTFTSLTCAFAKLRGAGPPSFPCELDADWLRETYRLMLTMPVSKRAALVNGSRRRAGVLIAGTAILLAVMEELAVPRITASGRGLRDGLMISLLREWHPLYQGQWRSGR